MFGTIPTFGTLAWLALAAADRKLRPRQRLMATIVAPILLTCLLAGCVSTRKAFDSWIGTTGADFIARAGLGPPDEVRSDGRGGQILVWGAAPNGVTQIYVDVEDVIYYWRTSGPTVY